MKMLGVDLMRQINISNVENWKSETLSAKPTVSTN